MSEPVAYLLTWTCYGTWLHGDERGSVDDDHNLPGTLFVEPDPSWERRARTQLRAPPVSLSNRARRIVLDAVAAHCAYRDWTLHAVSARTNHVHVVVTAPGAEPERVLSQFKTWCTRRLREAGLFGSGDRVWTTHGSTRYLWNEHSALAAVDYVLERQEHGTR